MGEGARATSSAGEAPQTTDRRLTHGAIRGTDLRGSEASDSGEIVLANDGYCAVCEEETRFVSRDNWLRDNYKCDRCGSIPRERALLTVLGRRYPAWRTLAIHQSSPGMPSSEHLRRSCPEGSLVTVHWGHDIGEIIAESSGLLTTIYTTVNRELGLDGELLEVLVSVKPK